MVFIFQAGGHVMGWIIFGSGVVVGIMLCVGAWLFAMRGFGT